MSTFKIATYNVNSIRSRLHIVIPWLRENLPDVLCMQETKVEDAEFPVAVFEEAGYHVVFSGEKRYNGVAIASRKEPEHVSSGLEDNEPFDTDRLIRGVFSGISVVNLYVPQGRGRDMPQFQYKLQWFDRLRAFLGKNYSPDDMVICCGDINVARENIDVHNPRRLLGHADFTPEVWDAFDSVMSWGLFDIFRKHHPGEEGQYAFFDYRVPEAVNRGLGWRVDHILTTAPLAGLSVDCRIDLEPRLAEKPSDHAVVIATFANLP